MSLGARRGRRREGEVEGEGPVEEPVEAREDRWGPALSSEGGEGGEERSFSHRRRSRRRTSQGLRERGREGREGPPPRPPPRLARRWPSREVGKDGEAWEEGSGRGLWLPLSVQRPTLGGPELGREEEGWRVMALFHHTPWELPPQGRRRVEDLVQRLRTGGGVPNWLEPSLEAVERLTEELPELSGGFDLLPYALDLRRMLSIALRSLSGDDPGMLRYLLEERLPYEHPMARALARTAGANGRGE